MSPTEAHHLLQRIPTELNSVDAIEAAVKAARPKKPRPLLSPLVPPRSDGERILASIFCEVLGLAEVGVEDDFFELGGDSLSCVQVVIRAVAHGLPLTLHQLYKTPTIVQLASAPARPRTVPRRRGRSGAALPLPPSLDQFFASFPRLDWFNSADLLEVPAGFEVERIERIFQHLVERHDAFRLRFLQDEDGRWRMRVLPPEDVPVAVERLDLSGVASAQVKEVVEKECLKWQARLSLTEGPLLRVVYLSLGSKRSGRLLVVIHHAVNDALSHRLLNEELRLAWSQLAQGKELELPPRSASFEDYVQAVALHSRSRELQAELGYWTEAALRPIPPLPREVIGPNEVSSSSSVMWARPVGAMRPEWLATSLIHALSRWSGQQTFRLRSFVNGRHHSLPDADPSRTVGWLAHHYPWVLSVDPAISIERKHQMLLQEVSRLPHAGRHYGTLRTHAPDLEIRQRLRADLEADRDVLFNVNLMADGFSGLTLPGCSRAPESPGTLLDPSLPRATGLSVTAVREEGVIRVRLGFSRNWHRPETIEALAADMSEAFDQLRRVNA